jgi:hypothetical protein
MWSIASGEARPAVARRVDLAPPLAQDRALLQALLEQPVRLGQALAVVGQARKGHRVLGHDGQQSALVTYAGHLDRGPLLAQRLPFREQRQVPVGVSAPGDLVAERDLAHGIARRPLIAAREELVVAPTGHVDLALEDRDARALDPPVDREHRPGDRDRAVAGGHERPLRRFAASTMMRPDRDGS